MILLLHKDLANLFRHRVFAERFALPDAIAVIANGLIFIVEIIPQHVFRIFRCAYRLGSDHWHFAEIVDLPREYQGMIELLLGVDFELGGDVHVLGTAEHLGIDHVGDDGLIFAGKVFVQQIRKTVAGNLVSFVPDLGSAIWFLRFGKSNFSRSFSDIGLGRPGVVVQCRTTERGCDLIEWPKIQGSLPLVIKCLGEGAR